MEVFGKRIELSLWGQGTLLRRFCLSQHLTDEWKLVNGSCAFVYVTVIVLLKEEYTEAYCEEQGVKGTEAFWYSMGCWE